MERTQTAGKSNVHGLTGGACGVGRGTRKLAGAVVLVLLLALSLSTSACRSATCCPPGPPYKPACSESFYYYFHGNQLQTVSVGDMLDTSPWRHTGRVRRGSGSGKVPPPFQGSAAARIATGGASHLAAP